MPSLIFVYNADSGVFNTLSDMAHKLFSPHTYACQLCRVTHGNFTMHREWKAFIENLDMPLEFLHRDELAATYGIRDMPLPAVLRRDGGNIMTLIDADAINSCETIDDLKKLLNARLESA